MNSKVFGVGEFNFSLFLPKFGCHGNSLGFLDILDSIFEFADPENFTIHAKNSSISCTEFKFSPFSLFVYKRSGVSPRFRLT